MHNLPLPALVGLGTLFVTQLVLMIWALVRLVNDKRERVAGLPRLAWGFIIVLGEIIGSTIFLVMHIKEKRAIAQQQEYQRTQAPNPSPAKSTASVISDLYQE